MMYKNINIDELRNDLINYFGTAMVNVSSLAMIDLLKIENANDEELIKIAIENNFDLNEYIVNEKCR